MESFSEWSRIARGRFTLEGTEHQVPVNDRGQALHGGPEGFHRQLWEGRVLDDGVELRRVSPDGEMGFPGRLEVTVTSSPS